MFDMLSQKRCSKCGETKYYRDFHKSSKSKDGLRSECKACVLAYQHAPGTKERHTVYMQEYRKNPEKAQRQKDMNSAYYPAYYKLHAEEIRKKTKEWSANNKERKAATDKAYRQSNLEKVKVTYKRWAANNYETIKANLLNRRSREKKASGSFTGKQWKEVISFYCPNGACLACGCFDKPTVDHVVPLFCGGTNYISNIQPLCKKCNRKKSTQTIDYRPDKGEFARRLQDE